MTKKTVTKWQQWQKKLAIGKSFKYAFLFFALLGLVASITISVEKYNLLKNPKEILICDINPIYSCGNVITSKQSVTLGISNEIYGIMLFAGLTAVALMLFAGAQPKRWFWRLVMLGMTGFSLTVFYLWYQSVYTIQSLCMFCSTVWFSGWTLTTLLYAWTYDQGVYKGLPKWTRKPMAYKRKEIVTIWLLVIALLIGLTLKHFWYFYGPKLGF